MEWVGWCHRAELPCGASSDNHPHVSRDLEPASPAQQKKWIAARSGVDTADFSICPCVNRSEQLGGTYPERSISCGLVSRRQQPRRCGGHGAVHGRNKYLNLFTCGGVALGSNRRPMPPRRGYPLSASAGQPVTGLRMIRGCPRRRKPRVAGGGRTHWPMFGTARLCRS